MEHLQSFSKQGKSPSESETIKTEVVCPNDTNPMGMLQGGRLVQWMDIAAAVCAQTHAEGICVTASIDSVRFFHSARVGDILVIKAKITRAFNTSMEIKVDTLVRNVSSPVPKQLSTAFFTFVAIDEYARKRPVVSVLPMSREDTENYELAAVRKKNILR